MLVIDYEEETSGGVEVIALSHDFGILKWSSSAV
jgi:hypothetical protein